MTPELPRGLVVCDDCHALIPEVFRGLHEQGHLDLRLRLEDFETLLLALEESESLSTLLRGESDALAKAAAGRTVSARMRQALELERELIEEERVDLRHEVTDVRDALRAERGLTRALLARMDEAVRALSDRDEYPLVSPTSADEDDDLLDPEPERRTEVWVLTATGPACVWDGPDSWKVLVGTHRRVDCEPGPCWMHAPTGHHMRDWPAVLGRGDRALRMCPHIFKHPDPDQAAFDDARGFDPEHDCDGCCQPPRA